MQRSPVSWSGCATHRMYALLKGVYRALEAPWKPTTEVHPVQSASIHHLAQECWSVCIVFPDSFAALFQVVYLKPTYLSE